MAQISLELHIFKPHIIKKGNPGTRVLSLQKPKPIRCKKPGFKPGSGTRVQSLKAKGETFEKLLLNSSKVIRRIYNPEIHGYIMCFDFDTKKIKKYEITDKFSKY